MDGLVSIIVPVYNIENYLEDCLQSILAQDYEDKELILIDDGSTDGSSLLCDKYADQYSWIKVIHKVNEGQSSARNCGFEYVSGEYLLFVDGDDFIHEQQISLLAEAMNTYKADIVVCDFEAVYSKVKLDADVKSNTDIKVFDGLEGVQALLYQEGFTSSPWAKLFRRELFESVRFPVGKIYEDLGTMYKVFASAQRVVFIPRKLYGYMHRAQSTVHTDFSPKQMDCIEMTTEMVAYVEQHYPTVVNAAYSRHFSACFQLMAMIPKGKYVDEQKQLIDEIKKYRKVILKDKQARFKNRAAALLSYINMDLTMEICRLMQH